METTTIEKVNRTPGKKMGASYKRTNKKQKRIHAIMDSTPIIPPHIRDDTEDFFKKPATREFKELKTREINNERFFPRYPLNANDPLRGLREFRYIISNTDPRDIVKLEFESLDSFRDRGELRINVSFNPKITKSQIVNLDEVRQYIQVLNKCGIVNLISDTVSELLSTGINDPSSYIMKDNPATAEIAEFLKTYNYRFNAGFRKKFNSFDFTHFSEEVCRYIYEEHAGKLRSIRKTFVMGLFMQFKSQNRVASMEVTSLLDSIGDTLIDLFDVNNFEKNRSLRGLSAINMQLADYIPEKVPTVEKVSPRKHFAYDKLSGKTTRYPK